MELQGTSNELWCNALSLNYITTFEDFNSDWFLYLLVFLKNVASAGRSENNKENGIENENDGKSKNEKECQLLLYNMCICIIFILFKSCI